MGSAGPSGGGGHDVLQDVLERSRDLGFLGPGPLEGQIHHAEAFMSAARASLGDATDSGADDGVPALEILDLGSGGGLPGLVILARWPRAAVSLLDASIRRTEFLREAIGELGVQDRSRILCGRAEELAHDPVLRERFDAVVARSFGPPPVTAECAAGLVRPGGLLITAEPPDPSDRWDEEGLAQLGFGRAKVFPGPPAIAVITKVSVCPDRFPHRNGVPAKRPLF
jgi:16S rRNA (guanine527-N7)-methyltransferase